MTANKLKLRSLSFILLLVSMRYNKKSMSEISNIKLKKKVNTSLFKIVLFKSEIAPAKGTKAMQKLGSSAFDSMKTS